MYHFLKTQGTRRGLHRGTLFGAALLCLTLVAWSLPFTRGSKAQAQIPLAPNNGSDVIGRYTFSELADKVLPSVVTVYVKRDIQKLLTPQQRDQIEKFKQLGPQLRQWFGPDLIPDTPGNGDDDNPYISQSSGSGVIISADGYIITNYHVVGNVGDTADIRVVFSDNSEVKGTEVKLVFSHDVADLAILKVNKSGLTPIKWGSSDKLRIGERVAAIGSPLDLRATITQGIVCAKHRDVDLVGGDMLQTDAVINPGSSGGALVNLDGELVGINRLITTNSGRWQGYGFAIPSDDAHRFADDVVAKGKVSYGFIGILMPRGNEDSPAIRDSLGLDHDAKGVLITNVTDGGPADKAGLETFDFITKADETDIDSSSELLGYVMRKHVGDAIRIKVLRPVKGAKPEERTFKLVVGERPDTGVLNKEIGGGQTPPDDEATPVPTQPGSLGMQLEPYNQGSKSGLRVKQIDPDSVAGHAGLGEGDIIVSLNRVKVHSQADFDRALKNKIGDKHILQFIHNGVLSIKTIGDK